jgi:hypothetical protein
VKKHASGVEACFGAVARIRTGDLLITNQLLYRLSYNGGQRADYLDESGARVNPDRRRGRRADTAHGSGLQSTR